MTSRLPLDGIRVLLTRAADGDDALARLLHAAGALVEPCPFITIGPPADERSLTAAIAQLADFSWLAFTSAHGVASFAARCPARLPAGLKMAAIGPSTAAAIEQRLRRPVDLVPPSFVAEALADSLVVAAQPGCSIMLWQAQDARPVLAARLRNAGFDITAVSGYTTVESAPPDALTRIEDNDAVIFASGSAVRALVHAVGAAECARRLRGKLIACLGPVTEAEARRFGLHVEIRPHASSAPALVEALSAYFAGNGERG
jgi:uroporphyrinogen-III synthase